MSVRTCEDCGCTDVTPCVTEGVACHWVGPDLCSACQDKLKAVLATLSPLDLASLDPDVEITDVDVQHVSINADGTTTTRMAMTLSDGREVLADWPGQWDILPITEKTPEQ